MKDKGRWKIEVAYTISFTDQDIEDIVVTALEGGIGYWARLDNTSQAFWDAPKDESTAETCTKILLEGGGITFLDTEDEETYWILTLDKLLKGIERWICGMGGFEYVSDGKLDLYMVDADAADSIFQMALFGEIVYG